MFPKSYAILMLILMIGLNRSSAQSIYGTVTELRCKDKISGVLVQLRDSRSNVIDSMTTNTNGQFNLKLKSRDKYSILLTCEGYDGPLFTNISIATDTSINLRIKKACSYINSSAAPVCPICHMSDQVIPIEYGLIKSRPGDGAGKKYMLGGCLVSDCDPHWYCKRDKRAL